MRFISPENGTLVDSTDVRGWGSELESGDILSVSGQTPNLTQWAHPQNQPISTTMDMEYELSPSSMIPAIQENDSLLIV